MAEDGGLNGGCHGDGVNWLENIDHKLIISWRQVPDIKNEELKCVMYYVRVYAAFLPGWCENEINSVQ